ncbi:serine O-acetyltransferase [Methylophaga nitratireducenticrescens]|uniref:Serine acetyltransferase n=1 Tax=Methylophaga nitratireducenticrescens TaxID=754476 RepID=I1XIN0_METNJ|nr:serine acetyltransferase [Methylophaga nitratireducenticrescens]AFI84249.1 serine acetyltransferase [Methylophaga nitratireducenticrescens]AUZ84327.1 serine acetyltransferase [Methylophaga nitratireducenticrescens]
MSNDITGISSEVADWQREKPTGFWMPNRKLLKSIRDYNAHNQRRTLLSAMLKRFAVLRYRFWSVITSADIPLNSQLGGGLSIPHPNGIVIHPSSLIGVNCLIHQQVTIGVKRGDPGAPIIGGHVDIGAGAKIIGNITIGEHALIGANAVVIKDVPAYAIVAGIPAKVIGFTQKVEP